MKGEYKNKIGEIVEDILCIVGAEIASFPTEAREENFKQQAKALLEKQIPKWIPVRERLPEDNQEVVTHELRGKMIMKYQKKSAGFYVSNGIVPPYFAPEYDVIQWMPLPEIPEEL